MISRGEKVVSVRFSDSLLTKRIIGKPRQVGFAPSIPRDNFPSAIRSTANNSIMSDSDESRNKSGVPSWQGKSPPTQSKDREEAAPKSPSQETIIEQAKKFLEDDEVRDASTDKKIAFLEGKGLNNEIIAELLGVSRNIEATASPHEAGATSQVRASSRPRCKVDC